MYSDWQSQRQAELQAGLEESRKELAEMRHQLAALQASVERSQQRQQQIEQLKASGELAKAIEILNDILQTEPRNEFAYQQRAEINSIRRNFDAALKDLATLLEFSSNKATVLQQRAKIYQQLGKYRIALADLTTALEITPDDSSIKINRAELLIEEERWDEALEELSFCLRKRPQDPQAKGHIELIIITIQKKLLSYLINGNYLMVINYANKLLAERSLTTSQREKINKINISALNYSAILQQCQQALQQQRYSEALVQANQLIVQNPNIQKAYSYLAWAKLFCCASVAEIWVEIKRILDFNPLSVEAYIIAALAYMKDQKLGMAALMLRYASAADFEQEAIVVFCAALLAKLRNEETNYLKLKKESQHKNDTYGLLQAIDQWARRLLLLDDRDISTLSELLQAEMDLADCFQIAPDTTRKLPQDLQLYNQAISWYNRMEFSSAIPLLLKALNVSSVEPACMEYLGHCYFQLSKLSTVNTKQNLSLALIYYQAAMQIDPNRRYLREKVLQLTKYGAMTESKSQSVRNLIFSKVQFHKEKMQYAKQRLLAIDTLSNIEALLASNNQQQEYDQVLSKLQQAQRIYPCDAAIALTAGALQMFLAEIYQRPSDKDVLSKTIAELATLAKNTKLETAFNNFEKVIQMQPVSLDKFLPSGYENKMIELSLKYLSSGQFPQAHNLMPPLSEIKLEYHGLTINEEKAKNLDRVIRRYLPSICGSLSAVYLIKPAEVIEILARAIALSLKPYVQVTKSWLQQDKLHFTLQKNAILENLQLSHDLSNEIRHRVNLIVETSHRIKIETLLTALKEMVVAMKTDHAVAAQLIKEGEMLEDELPACEAELKWVRENALEKQQARLKFLAEKREKSVDEMVKTVQSDWVPTDENSCHKMLAILNAILILQPQLILARKLRLQVAHILQQPIVVLSDCSQILSLEKSADIYFIRAVTQYHLKNFSAAADDLKKSQMLVDTALSSPESSSAKRPDYSWSKRGLQLQMRLEEWFQKVRQALQLTARYFDEARSHKDWGIRKKEFVNKMQANDRANQIKKMIFEKNNRSYQKLFEGFKKQLLKQLRKKIADYFKHHLEELHKTQLKQLLQERLKALQQTGKLQQLIDEAKPELIQKHLQQLTKSMRYKEIKQRKLDAFTQSQRYRQLYDEYYRAAQYSGQRSARPKVKHRKPLVKPKQTIPDQQPDSFESLGMGQETTYWQRNGNIWTYCYSDRQVVGRYKIRGNSEHNGCRGTLLDNIGNFGPMQFGGMMQGSHPAMFIPNICQPQMLTFGIDCFSGQYSDRGVPMSNVKPTFIASSYTNPVTDFSDDSDDSDDSDESPVTVNEQEVLNKAYLQAQQIAEQEANAELIPEAEQAAMEEITKHAQSQLKQLANSQAQEQIHQQAVELAEQDAENAINSEAQELATKKMEQQLQPEIDRAVDEEADQYITDEQTQTVREQVATELQIGSGTTENLNDFFSDGEQANANELPQYHSEDQSAVVVPAELMPPSAEEIAGDSADPHENLAFEDAAIKPLETTSMLQGVLAPSDIANVEIYPASAVAMPSDGNSMPSAAIVDPSTLVEAPAASRSPDFISAAALPVAGFFRDSGAVDEQPPAPAQSAEEQHIAQTETDLSSLAQESIERSQAAAQRLARYMTGQISNVRRIAENVSDILHLHDRVEKIEDDTMQNIEDVAGMSSSP
jgi:predicted nucleic acid-binding protein